MVKTAQDALARLQRRQKFLKTKIDQGRVLADGAGSPFWKSYKQILKEKLGSIESKLDHFESHSNDQIRVLLTTRAELKIFISTPDDFSRSLELMEEQLEKLNQEINGRKSKL